MKLGGVYFSYHSECFKYLKKMFYPHLRTCLLILERGEGRERVGERNIHVK